MRPRTECYLPYWEEHNQYPYFKKGKLKSYYRRKWFKRIYKDYEKE